MSLRKRSPEAGGCIGCVVPCGLIALAGAITAPVVTYALWHALFR